MVGDFIWLAFNSIGCRKGIKGFLYAQGEEHLFGHSVAELCKKVIVYDNEFESVKKASVLDKYYISDEIS